MYVDNKLTEHHYSKAKKRLAQQQAISQKDHATVDHAKDQIIKYMRPKVKTPLMKDVTFIKLYRSEEL